MATQEKYNAPFPTRLRDLLREKNTSMTTLAKELNISRQAISQYQDGTGQPNVDKLLKIAEYFKVSVDWLVGRDGSVESLDADVQSVAAYTGLNDGAIMFLHDIQLSKPALGVSTKGYTQPTLDVVNEILSSRHFLSLLNEISQYWVHGGALPAEAYQSDVAELSVDEYERFYKWANGKNLEIISRNDVCEMHLQKACDCLKGIARDALADEKKKAALGNKPKAAKGKEDMNNGEQ